jgi:hypothetical protein
MGVRGADSNVRNGCLRFGWQIALQCLSLEGDKLNTAFIPGQDPLAHFCLRVRRQEGEAWEDCRLHGEPPPNGVVTAFVPHVRGFPHGATIVSQGGHGTVMKALAHGLPLVCLPLCGAQPAVAARVVRHKECALAMAAPQTMAHHQHPSEVCEKKPAMAYTTGSRRCVEPRLTPRLGPPADRA